MVGHIAPEAQAGGALAAVRDGDSIVIDSETKELTLEVPEEELRKRMQDWRPRTIPYERGALAKYARLVSSASLGAVTS